MRTYTEKKVRITQFQEFGTTVADQLFCQQIFLNLSQNRLFACFINQRYRAEHLVSQLAVNQGEFVQRQLELGYCNMHLQREKMKMQANKKTTVGEEEGEARWVRKEFKKEKKKGEREPSLTSQRIAVNPV